MARCCRANDFGASCDSENLICSGEKKRGNQAKEERDPNAYGNSIEDGFSTARNFIRLSFFLDALSPISYRNDFPKPTSARLR